MKKRALSIFLALVLLIALLPIRANAAELDNGFSYTVYEDHVEITNYTWSYGAYDVVIPAEIEGKPVTVIGDAVFGAGFMFGATLNSISIPDTVTYIGSSVFHENHRLTTIDLPDNLTYLGSNVFYGCSNLTNISLPDSLTSLGNDGFGGSFENCSSLTNIDIPDGVTRIECFTFKNCVNLTSVTLPESLTSIGGRAFENCYSLRRITLPETLTSIESVAFYGCADLTSIVFRGDAPKFGTEYVFSNVTANAYYPAGNPTWTKDVMKGYYGRITWIPYDPSHPHEFTPSVVAPDCTEQGFTSYTCPCGYGYTDNYVYPLGHDYVNDICSRCSSNIDLQYTVHEDHVEITGYNGNSTAVSIPAVIEGKPVTRIREHAFYDCKRLNRIVIPESVTIIENRAFEDCYGLTSIHFTGNAPQFNNDTFWFVTATAYYPAGNPTWTEEIMHDFGGHITWSPYCPFNSHEYVPTVISPTCTDQGYTSYTCICGDSYVTDYVDALSHDYADGTCTRCGESDPDYVKPVENPFSDVPSGSWYEAPVVWALENGITAGTSANTFSPDDQCLRSQVMTFLWNAANKPEPNSYRNPFTDVPAGAWYEKPVLWAVENGITSGISATEFGANDVCSRYQVVFFLWKAAGSPEPTSTYNPFSDVKSTDFFYNAVLWAVENEITAGISPTEFGTYAPCTRAQVMTFLYNAYT